MAWNNNLSTSYGGARDLPKTYAEAAAACAHADKRRGGARGKIAHNTTIHDVCNGSCAVAYSVQFHATDIVTFLPDGSAVLDTGGYQTATTRDRMNRCGVWVSMADGVPSVSHRGVSYPYVDGMALHADGTVSYPAGREPVGTVEEIRARRRRALAASRRAWKRGDMSHTDPFRWPNRMGGYSCFRGTVPEVFREEGKRNGRN